MVLKKETKFGYRSNLYFHCTKCGHVDAVRTVDRRKSTEPNINYAAVLGIMSIEGAFSHLEELSCEFLLFLSLLITQINCLSVKGVMNISPMTKTTYYSKQKQIEEDIQTTLDKNFNEAMNEEIVNSKAKGLVDENGCPLAKCYADAAWCKRSYRCSYSALSGAASIIGHYARKVL